MNIIICLEEDDINTFKMGDHIQITTRKELSINFTKEAAIEMFNDLKELLYGEDETDNASGSKCGEAK